MYDKSSLRSPYLVVSNGHLIESSSIKERERERNALLWLSFGVAIGTVVVRDNYIPFVFCKHAMAGS